uniref:Uncharacterized protein n=1 Tax=Glossina pallidipes TaxID=7398 RepID=A0A1B0ADC3_GLOPL
MKRNYSQASRKQQTTLLDCKLHNVAESLKYRSVVAKTMTTHPRLEARLQSHSAQSTNCNVAALQTTGFVLSAFFLLFPYVCCMRSFLSSQIVSDIVHHDFTTIMVNDTSIHQVSVLIEPTSKGPNTSFAINNIMFWKERKNVHFECEALKTCDKLVFRELEKESIERILNILSSSYNHRAYPYGVHPLVN